MPSDSRELPQGTVLQGEKGEYCIIEKLGAGGNGFVYEVNIKNSVIENPPGKCAIKVFCPSLGLDDSRKTERFLRFLNEIHITQREKHINGLMPILDCHISSDAFSGLTWYLMPKANKYRLGYGLGSRIDDMISLGEIIKQLHERGIDHRDIKPSNLLYYNGHLMLSDLGLCWDESSDCHLTGSSEVIGPASIRPPEFERHRNLDTYDYDFKKSDVYLFAKTVWIVLSRNVNGFRGEYNRKDPQIYLDKKEIGVKTLEPMHKMMWWATRDNFNDRIDIEDCLHYLNIQKTIINETIDNSILNQYLSEETLGFANTFEPDEKHFYRRELVSQVLKRLSEYSFSVYIDDYGRAFYIGKYSSIEEINDANDYSIRLYDERIENYKSLIIHVSSLRLNATRSIIETSQCDQIIDNSKDCLSVKDLLEQGHSSYILRGRFSLKFDSGIIYENAGRILA